MTVTSLSSSGTSDVLGHDGEAGTEDELPLSQVLTSRSPRNNETSRFGLASAISSFTSSAQAVFNASSSPKPTTMIAAPAPTTQHHQRISFRSFHISHLALFFLKGGKLPYVAFNEGAPHYYLANESLQAAMQSGSGGEGSDKAPPAYICGEIIFIDTFQATEVWLRAFMFEPLLCDLIIVFCVVQDFNPYRLPYGTRFYVVTVANPKKT